MTLTETVDLHDVIDGYERDIDEARTVRDDLLAWADDHDDIDTDAPRSTWPDALATELDRIESTIGALEGRQSALHRFIDEYDGSEYTIRMLTGPELLDIEKALSIEAAQLGLDSVSPLTADRTRRVCEAGIVDGPEGAPDDTDAMPWPLMYALYEQIEALNQAGDTDFRPSSFDDATGDGAPPTPTTSPPSSTASPPTDTPTQPHGDS